MRDGESRQYFCSQNPEIASYVTRSNCKYRARVFFPVSGLIPFVLVLYFYYLTIHLLAATSSCNYLGFQFSSDIAGL